MNYFERIVNDVNRAYGGLIMSDQAYENMARGTYSDTTLAEPPTFGDAHYCQPEDETVEDTALAWLWECRKSEDAASSVMRGIEIAEYGNFVALAMHLLSDIGPYSDRNKIVNELQDALLDTLKKCADHE